MSDTSVTPPASLAGLKVLDLTSVVMGPLATQILGDLGADVVTVEPAAGDTSRIMSAGPRRQLSGISMNLLRNKRNVSIDLKHPEGRNAVLRILKSCDVLVTNLRPGPLRRLGLAYEDVVEVRPDIVYCQAAGFASDSDQAEEPAYDDIVQAASGLADAYRLVDGEPRLAPTILADKVCGLTIVYAVLAALLHRERTGEGQRIEVPMTDVMRSFVLVEHGAAAIPEPPLGPVGYQRILVANRRPQRTADGWIQILPYSEAHYDAIFRAGGREDLVGDPRYGDGPSRIAFADELYGLLQSLTPSRTTADWLEFCRDFKIPATALGTLDDLVSSLPVREHPDGGPYRVVPIPVRFLGSPSSIRRHAPLIGAHTVEVLREAGYSESDCLDLLEKGVVRQQRVRSDGIGDAGVAFGLTPSASGCTEE